MRPVWRLDLRSEEWVVVPIHSEVGFWDAPPYGESSMHVFLNKSVRRTGVWAPVSETEALQLHVFDSHSWEYVAQPPPGAWTAAVAHVRDELGFGANVASRLATPPGSTRTRVLWRGWIHTVVALAAMIAAVVLVPWRAIPGWLPSAVRRVCRLGVSKPGTRPSCGYDLAGLAVRRCPECGQIPAPTTDAAIDRGDS